MKAAFASEAELAQAVVDKAAAAAYEMAEAARAARA